MPLFVLLYFRYDAWFLVLIAPNCPITAIIWLCFLQNESSNVVFGTSSVTSGVQFEVVLTADLLTLQGETTAFPPLELVCTFRFSSTGIFTQCY